MNIILIALFAISVLTSLTVQGIKKLLDERGKKYSANVLAAVVATILAVAISAAYLIYNGIVLTPRIIMLVIALVYLSFLVATVGYDKVVQAIRQIGGMI